MSKPAQPKSLEMWIAYYLYKYGIRLGQHTFDHHYARLARDKFCKEITQDIYDNHHKIHNFNTNKTLPLTESKRDRRK